jgi:molybdopterin converting factor small subunit
MVAKPISTPPVTADDPAVTVRLFAGAAELAGVRAWRLQIRDGMTIQDAFLRMCHDFPSLSKYAGRLLFALNAEYAGPQSLIRAGDEICLITPVSGGASG